MQVKDEPNAILNLIAKLRGSLDLAAIPHVDLAYKIKIAIEMNMQKQPNTIILKKQTPKEEQKMYQKGDPSVNFCFIYSSQLKY